MDDDARDKLIVQLVNGQSETNRQLAELNRKLDLVLTEIQKVSKDVSISIRGSAPR